MRHGDLSHGSASGDSTVEGWQFDAGPDQTPQSDKRDFAAGAGGVGTARALNSFEWRMSLSENRFSLFRAMR